MSRSDVLLRLIDQVYAVPGTTASWAEVLTDLGRVTHASGVNLVSHDLLDARPVVSVTVGLDPQAVVDYVRQWGGHDPWAYSAGTRTLAAGALVAGEQLVPRSTLTRTAFYHEFGSRYDVTRCLAGFLDVDARGVSCLTLNRGDRGRDFDTTDAPLISALLPHLRRALRLQRCLEDAAGAAAVRGDALDLVPYGVLVLGRDATVLYANMEASRLLRQSDGLRLDRGTLRASTTVETTTLHRAVASARQPAADGKGRPSTLALSRPSGARALMVLVSRSVPALGSLTLHAAVSLVVVHDPDRRLSADVDALGCVLQLTPAEARLTRALADGQSLDEIAQRFALSAATLRSQLKQVFAKTGTHRQAELVRLVLPFLGLTGK